MPPAGEVKFIINLPYGMQRDTDFTQCQIFDFLRRLSIFTRCTAFPCCLRFYRLFKHRM